MAALLLWAWLLLAGCRAKHRRGPELPKLSAASWLEALPVSGFGAAALAVPLGAREPRPILIALHGVADRPEWACAAWRAVAGPEPFVLCPRGRERSDFGGRFSFGELDQTKAELRAALHALKQRYGAHVRGGSVLLAGFEIGADQAAEIAREEPSFFSRLALVEPTPGVFSPTLSAIFVRGGGRNVLFACTTPRCRSDAELRATLLRRARAGAKLAPLGDLGVRLDGPVRHALATEWKWLGSGDPAWGAPGGSTR